LLRSWRVSERWGPIAPIRRVEPFRDDEPAEREWIRHMPSFDTRSSHHNIEDYAAPDWSAAALYNESGRLRNLAVLEVGKQMDLEG
jgi:hypothetical protein